jgi:hypothetical protein
LELASRITSKTKPAIGNRRPLFKVDPTDFQVTVDSELRLINYSITNGPVEKIENETIFPETARNALFKRRPAVD